jgi:hypothetical protein
LILAATLSIFNVFLVEQKVMRSSFMRQWLFDPFLLVTAHFFSCGRLEEWGADTVPGGISVHHWVTLHVELGSPADSIVAIYYHTEIILLRGASGGGIIIALTLCSQRPDLF